MSVIQTYLGFVIFSALCSMIPEIDVDNSCTVAVATIFDSMWIVLSILGQDGLSTYYAGILALPVAIWSRIMLQLRSYYMDSTLENAVWEKRKGPCLILA